MIGVSRYRLTKNVECFAPRDDSPYSRDWNEQFLEEQLRLGRMTQDTDFSADPRWQMLPLARRIAAMTRLRVMVQYDDNSNPTEADALDAAHRLGVTLSQFYRIRRQWLRNRSIMDLLPYGMPGTTRKPKISEAVEEALKSLISDIVSTEGIRRPAEILRRVQARWSLDEVLPSHMTVRKRIAETLGDLENVAGGLRQIHPGIPPSALEMATAYGSVLVVDHVALACFVSSEGGPVRPFATLAIDLFTSSIAGAYLSFGAPGPLQTDAALRDADRRSQQAASSSAESVKPHLVLTVDVSAGWSRMIADLELFGYTTSSLSTSFLQYAEVIKAIIGTSLGYLPFSFRRFAHVPFDPHSDALLNFSELKILFEKELTDLNRRRIAAEVEVRHIVFDY